MECGNKQGQAKATRIRRTKHTTRQTRLLKKGMFSHRELHSRCSFLIPTTSSILLSFAYIVSSQYTPLTLWKYCEYLIMWANLPRDDQTLNARFVKGVAHGEKGFISLQGRACCAGRGPGNTGVLCPVFLFLNSTHRVQCRWRICYTLACIFPPSICSS